MRIKVDVTDYSEQYGEELEKVCKVALEAVGMQAEGHAKVLLERSPRRIDTGLLRNSITHAVSGEQAAMKSYHASYGSNRTEKGNRRAATSRYAGSVGVGRYSGTAPTAPDGEMVVWIGTNVEYAIYVHNGTHRMAANRFLERAVTNYGREYAGIVKAYLEGDGE